MTSKKYPDRLWCIKLTGWMYLLDFLRVQARCAKYSAQDSRQVNYHSFSFSRESNKPTLKKSFVWDIFSVVQAPCKHQAYTFKDHESATEAHCKLTMRTLVKHNQVICVRALVRELEQAEDARPSCRTRSRTRGRRLHELNNPRLGKNCRGKWNFPTRGGKKRRRANPPACLGPTMSGRKNGYKKIKGCRVGGC